MTRQKFGKISQVKRRGYMHSVGTVIQGYFSSFSEKLLNKSGRDFFGTSTLFSVTMALYFNFSLSASSQIGSKIAPPMGSRKKEKNLFLPEEREKMRDELDRLQRSINHLWVHSKKAESRSILKKGSGGGKFVHFSEKTPHVQEVLRLKDGPLLSNWIDLSAEPKLEKKLTQRTLF